MNFRILYFDTIESTNSEAIKQAKQGVDEGLCVSARQQTAGRGRHGRKWVSEMDTGLYFSIVLRPKVEMRFLPLITLMAGVAVHDTLVGFGLKPDIKWVNDIHVSDKKISGILAETTEAPDGLAVIVGIGINLRSTNFPQEIAGKATSMEEVMGNTFNGGEVLQTLTRYIDYFYGILCSENGGAKIIDEWKQRSTYFSGKAVRAVLENETITGITVGLEANGALRIRTADGGLRIIQAGDIEQLRQI